MMIHELRITNCTRVLYGYNVSILNFHFQVITKTTTKRAYHIWKDLFQNKAEISVISAKDDPFQPDGWWKSGRQMRWVLAEYGAWIYYFWKDATNPVD